MVQIRSINKIFKEDNLPIELVKGEGYFYYIFDMCKSHNVYETQSEYIYRLNDMTKDEWVRRGREFALEMIHEHGINL